MPSLDAVERLRSRGHEPGLIKIQLASVQDKVALLKRNQKLKDDDRYYMIL